MQRLFFSLRSGNSVATNQKRSKLIDFLSSFSVTSGGVQKANPPGGVNNLGFVHAYVAGGTLTVTDVSQASPAVLRTSTPHGLPDQTQAGNTLVFIAGATMQGPVSSNANNTAGANQGWVVTAVTTPTSTISTAGNGSIITITTTAAHSLTVNDWVRVAAVTGNSAANGLWQITNISTFTFDLVGSSGTGFPVGTGGTVSVANKLSVPANTSTQPPYLSGGTVRVFQKIWKTRDKLTEWTNASSVPCIVPLDGNGRPAAPLFGDGVYDLAVYDSALGLQYSIDSAEYGGLGVVVDVKEDFGAKGDAKVNGNPGSEYWTGTDDTLAIQEALDWGTSYEAANPGSMARIHFPPGGYLIGSGPTVPADKRALQLARYSFGEYQPLCIELYGDHRMVGAGISGLPRRGA